MNKKRLKGYESPTTELIELRVEGGILTNSTDTFGINDWQNGDTELNF